MQKGSSNRGRGRFFSGSRLGRWFGIGETDNMSDPIVEPTQTQNEAGPSQTSTYVNHEAPTQSSQTPSAPMPQAPPPMPQAPVPRGRGIFVRPRQRSERILKKKLAKNQPGIGSSSSSPHNLS